MAWSSMNCQISCDAKSVEITTRPDFLPERQKTTILVGVRIETDSPVRIKLWRWFPMHYTPRFYTFE